MMISTKGRYALRVMIDLAQHADEGFIPLKEIAERKEASLKYLENIVSLLSKGDVIQSQRGKEGGYKLSKPASEITVGEIVRLTEGKLAPVQCLEWDENRCGKSDTCLTLPMWEKLDSLIGDYLGSVSIEDIISGKLRTEGAI